MKPLQGLAWLLVMQLAGEALSRALSLPVPGPVIGMLLLWPALSFAPVREQVTQTARFLLGHLSLLFIPVGVGVITHLDVLSHYGLRLARVIVLSTWVGMAATALVLRRLMRSHTSTLDEAAPEVRKDA